MEESNILLGIELYFYANYSFVSFCKYGFWSHERTHSIVWLGSLEVNASVLIGFFFLDSITNPSVKSNLYGSSTYEQNDMTSFSSPLKHH